MNLVYFVFLISLWQYLTGLFFSKIKNELQSAIGWFVSWHFTSTLYDIIRSIFYCVFCVVHRDNVLPFLNKQVLAPNLDTQKVLKIIKKRFLKLIVEICIFMSFKYVKF